MTSRTAHASRSFLRRNNTSTIPLPSAPLRMKSNLAQLHCGPSLNCEPISNANCCRPYSCSTAGSLRTFLIAVPYASEIFDVRNSDITKRNNRQITPIAVFLFIKASIVCRERNAVFTVPWLASCLSILIVNYVYGDRLLECRLRALLKSRAETISRDTRSSIDPRSRVFNTTGRKQTHVHRALSLPWSQGRRSRKAAENSFHDPYTSPHAGF